MGRRIFLWVVGLVYSSCDWGKEVRVIVMVMGDSLVGEGVVPIW